MNFVMTMPSPAIETRGAALAHLICETVYVYGTLRTGQRNHAAFLSLADGLGVAAGEAPLLMRSVHDAYPALLHAPGETMHPLTLEAFAVTAQELQRLDDLEGVPSLYRRIMVGLHGRGDGLPPGFPKQGWIYVAGPEARVHAGQVVASGDWAEYAAGLAARKRNVRGAS